MNLLAFDNATATCSVALQCGDRIFTREITAPKQQAKLILPMINEVLSEAGLSLADLNAIVFGGGPGSYTGVRIASSVAQGLGFATGIPLIRLSSLAALAQAAFIQHQWRHVLVGLDARMGQIYWASYQVNAQGSVELLGDEQVATPEKINFPPAADWYGVGDGWANYPALSQVPNAIIPKEIDTGQLNCAKALLVLAKPAYEAGEWIAPAEAIPVYLR